MTLEENSSNEKNYRKESGAILSSDYLDEPNGFPNDGHMDDLYNPSFSACVCCVEGSDAS